MPNDQSEAMEERAPKTLNMAILRGRMDPDGARRTLREAIDEGDPEEDRAAVDEMKHFLHENPIRL